MSAMSDFVENATINQVLRGVAYPGGSTIHVALFTTPTDDAGGGTEVFGGGYQRTVVASFDPPTAGTTTSSSTTIFPTATGNWGTLTHFALFDAQVGGNMLYHGELTAPKTTNAGDSFVLSPGNITISHD